MTEQSEKELRFDSTREFVPVLQRTERPDYFQLWHGDGTIGGLVGDQCKAAGDASQSAKAPRERFASRTRLLVRSASDYHRPFC